MFHVFDMYVHKHSSFLFGNSSRDKSHNDRLRLLCASLFIIHGLISSNLLASTNNRGLYLTIFSAFFSASAFSICGLEIEPYPTDDRGWIQWVALKDRWRRRRRRRRRGVFCSLFLGLIRNPKSLLKLRRTETTLSGSEERTVFRLHSVRP